MSHRSKARYQALLDFTLRASSSNLVFVSESNPNMCLLVARSMFWDARVREAAMVGDEMYFVSGSGMTDLLYALDTLES